jgi:hypothetical protein
MVAPSCLSFEGVILHNKGANPLVLVFMVIMLLLMEMVLFLTMVLLALEVLLPHGLHNASS